MYPLRLLLRPFAKECQFVSRSFAYSSKSSKSSKKKERVRHFDSLPGIRRQMNHLDLTPEDLEDLEDFDGDELNISAAEELFDMHKSEMASTRRKRELAMYGQKYYKQKKEPPLLTYDDIEQIHKLHKEEAWPVQELAKTFPASEAIIEKIVKTSYTPSYDRKLKHDQQVSTNWELLKKGKLEISEELRQHCLKFTNRKAFPTACKDVVIKKHDYNVKGAFSAILDKPEDTVKNDEKPAQDEIDSEEAMEYYAVMKRVRMKITTLEEERKRKLESASQAEPLNDEDRAFVLGVGPTSISTTNEAGAHTSKNREPSVVTKVKSPSQVIASKWDSSGKSKEATRDLLMAPIDKYPEHITIPETAKKTGSIYRLEDCFYDESGDFLYRVPGLKL